MLYPVLILGTFQGLLAKDHKHGACELCRAKIKKGILLTFLLADFV